MIFKLIEHYFGIINIGYYLKFSKFSHENNCHIIHFIFQFKKTLQIYATSGGSWLQSRYLRENCRIIMTLRLAWVTYQVKGDLSYIVRPCLNKTKAW